MKRIQAALWSLLVVLALAKDGFKKVNATGTLSGQVTDASGSAVANAEVRATGFTTAVRRDITLQIQQTVQQANQ